MAVKAPEDFATREEYNDYLASHRYVNDQVREELDHKIAMDSVAFAENVVTHLSGGKREAAALPYFAIPTEWLREIAAICKEGAERYGMWNWQKGLPASEYYNHMIEHLNRWREGDRTEPHLYKVAWGAMALAWTMKHKPELDDIKQ